MKLLITTTEIMNTQVPVANASTFSLYVQSLVQVELHARKQGDVYPAILKVKEAQIELFQGLSQFGIEVLMIQVERGGIQMSDLELPEAERLIKDSPTKPAGGLTTQRKEVKHTPTPPKNQIDAEPLPVDISEKADDSDANADESKDQRDDGTFDLSVLDDTYGKA